MLVFCLVFVWLFLVFSCFCCLFAVVCFVCGNDGFLGYVQVRHQFSLAVLNQQTASRFNLEINDFAMPWGVLNDLAKAMKALDGKKNREDDESVHAAPEGATALLDHMRADEGTALF